MDTRSKCLFEQRSQAVETQISSRMSANAGKYPMLRFTNEHGVAHVTFEMTDEDFKTCPECHGMKHHQFVKDGYRMVAPCSAARTEARMDLYNAANIPSKFRNASFDNFDLKSLKGTGETINAIFIHSVLTFQRGQRGILLEGGPGSGKTHLLCAAAQYLTLELHQSVRYVDFSVLLSQIRSLYQQNNASMSEADLINDIVSVPVLLLDELGKGRDKTNEFEMRIIDEIINRRYNDDSLTTYFASNYRDRNTSGYKLFQDNGIHDCNSTRWLNFAKNKCSASKLTPDQYTQYALSIMKSDHLEDRLEPRIVSRIFELATPLFLEAPDRRTKM